MKRSKWVSTITETVMVDGAKPAHPVSSLFKESARKHFSPFLRVSQLEWREKHPIPDKRWRFYIQPWKSSAGTAPLFRTDIPKPPHTLRKPLCSENIKHIQFIDQLFMTCGGRWGWGWTLDLELTVLPSLTTLFSSSHCDLKLGWGLRLQKSSSVSGRVGSSCYTQTHNKKVLPCLLSNNTSEVRAWTSTWQDLALFETQM